MEEKALPIKMTYQFDGYLMFLIQDVTKKESIDILAFFSDLAKAIATVGVEKRTGKSIRKTVRNFFPNTAIPFQILVKGNKAWSRDWDTITGWYKDEEREVFSCCVEVGFPEDGISFSEEKITAITEALIERDLLGGSGTQLQPFDKPDTKTPKIYKKMMESICGASAPKRTAKLGYDPDITGNCRNCGGNPSIHRICECKTDE